MHVHAIVHDSTVYDVYMNKISEFPFGHLGYATNSFGIIWPNCELNIMLTQRSDVG